MSNLSISIKGLKKIYSGGTEALKGVDLEVEEGAFFALLGPNGAGKTTLLQILSHLQAKTEGVLKVCGVDLEREPERAKAFLGVVPQEFNFSKFENIEEILVKQAAYYGVRRKIAYPKALELLKELGLYGKKGQPAFRLSGGMQRRLMVARALVHSPKILLLDEPTTGVDVEMRRSLWTFLEKLNKSGTTIILTTHYLEEAELLSDQIAIINHGKIIGSYKKAELSDHLNEQVFVVNYREQEEGSKKRDKGIEKTFSSAPYPIEPKGSKTFEVSLKKGESLNPLFAWMDTFGLDASSVHLKTGRLESLMIKILEGDEHSSL